MGNYQLDSEMRRYVDRCNQLYPDDAIDLTLDDNRRMYLEMAQTFQAPTPDQISKTDLTIDGRGGPIPVRYYQNEKCDSETIVLYFHGGGFILGNIETHDSICAEIAHLTNFKVIAVQYRLAPEHIHPAQFEDAMDVFLEIDQGKTILAGDSAGGTLSAAISIHQRREIKKPIGQVLIYPWLGGDLLNLPSYANNFDAPGLTTDDMTGYLNFWTGNQPDKMDPTCYPLAEHDYSGVPPCIAFSAQHDPICDDAEAYVQRINKFSSSDADTRSRSSIELGLIHGYLRARHSSEKAAKSFHRICQAISELGGTG